MRVVNYYWWNTIKFQYHSVCKILRYRTFWTYTPGTKLGCKNPLPRGQVHDVTPGEHPRNHFFFVFGRLQRHDGTMPNNDEHRGLQLFHLVFRKKKYCYIILHVSVLAMPDARD